MTVGYGNMKLIGDPGMSHFHGVERTDTTRWRLRGEIAGSKYRQEFWYILSRKEGEVRQWQEQDLEQVL